MQWFECWFNTPYYHLLYGKRNEEEAAFFLDNLLKYLNLPTGASCWDLNCGKGRHSVYLHKKGFDVIGTDIAEESIVIARQSENDTLHFYTHDMRGLFYANYFNAVFNLFTSFGYFKSKHEDEKVFKSVANSLKPGGVFVLDFFNTELVLKKLVSEENKTICDVDFKIKKKTENGFIIKEIVVKDKGKELRYKEEVHAFTLSDFEHFAQAAGLKIKKMFGNYKLEHFNASTSERLIIIFAK
ncbi:MAG TPA: class I SAM-dependent methyltransferase [Bacteroidia bacterium]|jgi:SAM-dependent methyltransferase|nr:class I SAM-dependent methyltransferase [Bacteroidia bacterium]